MRSPSLAWLSDSERRLTGLAWLGAVVLLVVGAALGVRNERAFRSDRVAETSAQAQILASSLTAALSFDDRAAMSQYVQALSANPRIAAAAVYSPDGRRLVAFDPAGDGAPARLGRTGSGWTANRVTATRAATEQGQVLGFVYLETAPDTLPAALVRHTGVGLLTVMGLLLLVLVSAAAARLQQRAGELVEANARLTAEMGARARAEQALRQSQKMEALGQLTGGIAHDFNNLLQVIMGALELIRRSPGENDRVQRWAENALKAGDRGASLTRQLLAFSRSQKLDLKAFLVSDLVRGMRDLLHRTLGPDIELRLELDDRGIPVLSDQTQLELAILNLTINARDAMLDGGVVTISSTIRTIGSGHPTLTADDYVALCVADTGPGMSADVVSRAFDPFFTTKSVGKGTGLGLSQVYGVARQAGGEATIESAPGKGTRVTVLLRRSAQAAEPAAGEARPAPIAARVPGATVLVVDDDDGVRSLVRDTLELLGYRVTEAESGEAALDRLRGSRPAAMVLDFAMPKMNGAQVAERARVLWPDLPIVIASGYADTAAVDAAIGPDVPVLHKPFDMEALARTIGGMIDATSAGAA